MIRRVGPLGLLAVVVALTGCKFEHARSRGPLASVADSLRHHARSIDCEVPDHRIFDSIDYRVCSTEVGSALYDVDADGRILSVAELWSVDSSSVGRTRSLIADLDQHASRVEFPAGSGSRLGIRWKGDSLCHTVVVDSAAEEVIYIRTLRALSSDCTQG